MHQASAEVGKGLLQRDDLPFADGHPPSSLVPLPSSAGLSHGYTQDPYSGEDTNEAPGQRPIWLLWPQFLQTYRALLLIPLAQSRQQ